MSASTTTDSTTPDDPFAAIATRARTRNVERAETILGGLTSADLEEEQRTALRDLAHQIAGSAGTFGNDEASRTAAQLQTAFDGDADLHGLRALAQLLLDQLR